MTMNATTFYIGDTSAFTTSFAWFIVSILVVGIPWSVATILINLRHLWPLNPQVGKELQEYGGLAILLSLFTRLLILLSIFLIASGLRRTPWWQKYREHKPAKPEARKVWKHSLAMALVFLPLSPILILVVRDFGPVRIVVGSQVELQYLILKKSRTIDLPQIRSAKWEDHKSYVPGHPDWSSIMLVEKNGKQIKIESEPDDWHTNQLLLAYKAINRRVNAN